MDTRNAESIPGSGEMPNPRTVRGEGETMNNTTPQTQGKTAQTMDNQAESKENSLRITTGILNQSSQPTPSIANAELEPEARRRPHSTSLRRAVEGKIANTLIKLRGSGLAESTLKYALWLLS